MSELKQLIHKHYYRCAWDKQIYFRATNTRVPHRAVAEFINRNLDSDGMCPECLKNNLAKLKIEKRINELNEILKKETDVQKQLDAHRELRKLEKEKRVLDQLVKEKEVK